MVIFPNDIAVADYFGFAADPSFGEADPPEVQERSRIDSVVRTEDDKVMTTPALTGADWRKLAVAGVGSVAIGIGTLFSPLIPIGAIVLGAAIAMVFGLRSARTR